jgi:hypothetical protein
MQYCSTCLTKTTICPFGQDCRFKERCKNGDCHCGSNLHRKGRFNYHSASGGGYNSRGSNKKNLEKIAAKAASISIGNAIGIHDLNAVVGSFVKIEDDVDQIYKIEYIHKDLIDPHLVKDGTLLIISLESNNKIGYNDKYLVFTKDDYHYGGMNGIRKPFKNLQLEFVPGMTAEQFYPPKPVFDNKSWENYIANRGGLSCCEEYR